MNGGEIGGDNLNVGTEYTSSNKLTHSSSAADGYASYPIYWRCEPGLTLTVSFNTDITTWASNHGGAELNGKWTMWIYWNELYDPSKYNIYKTPTNFASGSIKSMGNGRWYFLTTVPSGIHMGSIRINSYSSGAVQTGHFWDFKISRGHTTGAMYNSLHAIPHNISTGDGKDGIKNTAFHFDNNSWLEIPPVSITNGTVCFWLKLDSTDRTWLSLTGQGGGSKYLGATDGGGAFYHGGCGSPTSYVDGVARTTPIIDTNWHHIAFSGVNLSGWTEIYLNKYVEETNSFNLTGSYLDFKIFDTALNATQIQQEM